MKNTEEFLRRRYDLQMARGLIIALLVCVSAFASLVACTVLYGWSVGWAVLGGFLLFVPIIQLPYFILVQVESGQTLLRQEGSTTAHPDAKSPVEPPPGVRIVGEGVSVTPTSVSQWLLRVPFSVFNASAGNITIYDMHVRPYCRWVELVPSIAMTIRGRRDVSLDETNSITHEGKVYDVAVDESESFTLNLHISRTGDHSGDTWTLAVFGVFVHLHVAGTSFCLPCDCVCVFLNLPPEGSVTGRERFEIFHVNEGNIARLWQQHYQHPSWRRVLKVVDAALETHLNSVVERP